MIRKTLLFASFLGVVLASYQHEDPFTRNRIKRYAPARNDHHLLQDTLVPTHYDLTIRPDIYRREMGVPAIDKLVFDGNVTIYFKCVRSTNRIKLHSTRLNINENAIKVTGGQGRTKVTSIDKDEKKSFVAFHLNKRLRKGQEYTISLSYSAPFILNALEGLYLTGERTSNATKDLIAITQMEPNSARSVFPCFDEPALKATFSITVLRKASHVALSNMPLIKSDLLENGWFADSFDKTPVMPTYLVAIAVTAYKFKEGKTKDGIKIRVWYKEEELDDLDLALDIAIKSTEWFTEYTGINYTLPKMDHIAVPDFSFGGMENWGLIVYSLGSLLYKPTDGSNSRWNRVTEIVIHEIAHQWFGNLVTAKWWNEIWINEAMTSHMTYVCKGEIVPEADMLLERMRSRAHALNIDKYHTSHPIDYSVIRQSELEYVFDAITYVKGSLILLMLESVIGEKEFRQGIQIFLQTHKFGNADQYDFYDAFNEALHFSDKLYLSQVDVGEFMSTWMQQAGYPVLTIIHDEEGIKLNQTRFLADPEAKIPDKFESPFGNEWIIPLMISTNATGRAVQTPPVWMHDSEVDISAELDFNHNVTTWILGNHGMKGYYIVNYDERNWMLLADQLQKDHTVIPEINRASMITDLASLVSSGKLHVHHSLHLLRYLRDEKSFLPWWAFFRNIRSHWSNRLKMTTNYGVLRAFMLEIVGHMYRDEGWEPVQGGVRLTRKRELQTLVVTEACQYDYKPCLEKAHELYKNAETKPVLPDLRRVLYCSAVKGGTVDDWDELYNLFIEKLNSRTHDPTIEDIVYGLSCSKEEWVLRRFLKRAVDQKQELYTTFSYVAKNPIGAHLALETCLQRWNETKDYYLIDTLSENLSTQEDLDMLLEFLEANPEEKDGDFQYFLDMSIEKMTSNIDWIEDDGKKVVEWLNEMYNEDD